MRTEPTATTYLVLGYLFLSPRSGYEIRTAFNRGARFFWNVSPAQLYPELKRLEAAGLIAGEDASRGARPKVVYRLTDAGRSALEEWLGRPAAVLELRDESLLKLFFADAVTREQAVALLRARRSALTQRLAALEAIAAETAELKHAASNRLPWLTLDYGLELTRWQADWCDRAEERIVSGDYAQT